MLFYKDASPNDLSIAEWQRIAKVAKSILLKAIACRGTSVSDWRDLFGQQGEYQHKLQVYKQAGEPCSHCGGTVIRRTLGGTGHLFLSRLSAVGKGSSGIVQQP